MLRGDVKQAEPHFAAALAKASSTNLWQFRHELFRVRVKAGKAADTYREVKPGTATFESLASLCFQEKDAKQLQALIDAHRGARPADANIPFRELDVRWLNQDYEGTLKLLIEHREGPFAAPRFRWKTEDYRVRCLVKLKRTEDAIREAETLAKSRFGNRMLLVLAHASRGNVQQTIAVLDKLRPESYLLMTCYQDADLGSILRSEPFRELREKFPEPKDKPGRAGRDLDDL